MVENSLEKDLSNFFNKRSDSLIPAPVLTYSEEILDLGIQAKNRYEETFKDRKGKFCEILVITSPKNPNLIMDNSNKEISAMFKTQQRHGYTMMESA
jgi:hypothetical protein